VHTASAGAYACLSAVAAPARDCDLPLILGTSVNVLTCFRPIELMHEDPWFFTVAAASLIGWILGAVKGFSTSLDWWKSILLILRFISYSYLT
jgi:hypothetical protein